MMKWDEDWNPEDEQIFTLDEEKELEKIAKQLTQEEMDFKNNLMIVLKDIRDMLAVIVSQRKGRM